MRAVIEGDLSATAKRVVKAGEKHGWALVGVVSTDTQTGEAVLTLRGQRVVVGVRQRFVVLFLDGAYDAAWWLTRRHQATVKGYREVEHVTKDKAWSWNIGKKLVHDTELDEVVEWTDERATFVKVTSLSVLLGVASRNTPGLLEVGTLQSVAR